MSALILPGLAVLVVGCVTTRHWVKRHGFWVLLFRFLSGHALDGQFRTNAGWTTRATRVLHNSGHAIWWHHLPRLHRAGIRTGGTALTILITYGLIAATFATVVSLCAAAAAAVTFCAWHGVHMIRTWQHERHNVRPLERTLMRGIPERPVSLEVTCERDTESDADVITGVVVEWPPGTEIREPEKQYALEAVTTRLPIEAPDAKWELKGRARLVTFTPSEPPPPYVEWEGRIAAAVAAAAANELVFGIGKRDAVNGAAYSQSPHLCIPGGSGGGKSNLAAFLLLQEMVHGSLIINLDPKWISHLWLQGLPNVINAHEPAHLHLALVWTGRELVRRTKTAYYSAGGTGRVRGSVGARIVVLAEELNYGMPGMKEHWRETRTKDQPKQSPAISAMSALACAGRASDIHEWLIAQLLTVESTGVRDSTIRTNAGIKAMIRHDKSGWDMAVGKNVPMPPPSDIQGRIQLVTGNGVPQETQVPYLHLDDPDEQVADRAVRWARELAVSGVVAQIPTGPEGVPEELWPPVVRQGRLALNAGQGGSTGATEGVTATGPQPLPPSMTLREAIDRGIFGDRSLGAVRRAIQRAQIEDAGLRDGAKEYHLSDLHAIAKGGIRDN